MVAPFLDIIEELSHIGESQEDRIGRWTTNYDKENGTEHTSRVHQEQRELRRRVRNRKKWLSGAGGTKCGLSQFDVATFAVLMIQTRFRGNKCRGKTELDIRRKQAEIDAARKADESVEEEVDLPIRIEVVPASRQSKRSRDPEKTLAVLQQIEAAENLTAIVEEEGGTTPIQQGAQTYAFFLSLQKGEPIGEGSDASDEEVAQQTKLNLRPGLKSQAVVDIKSAKFDEELSWFIYNNAVTIQSMVRTWQAARCVKKKRQRELKRAKKNKHRLPTERVRRQKCALAKLDIHSTWSSSHKDTGDMAVNAIDPPKNCSILLSAIEKPGQNTRVEFELHTFQDSTKILPHTVYIYNTNEGTMVGLAGMAKDGCRTLLFNWGWWKIDTMQAIQDEESPENMDMLLITGKAGHLSFECEDSLAVRDSILAGVSVKHGILYKAGEYDKGGYDTSLAKRISPNEQSSSPEESIPQKNVQPKIINEEEESTKGDSNLDGLTYQQLTQGQGLQGHQPQRDKQPRASGGTSVQCKGCNSKFLSVSGLSTECKGCRRKPRCSTRTAREKIKCVNCKRAFYTGSGKALCLECRGTTSISSPTSVCNLATNWDDSVGTHVITERKRREKELAEKERVKRETERARKGTELLEREREATLEAARAVAKQEAKAERTAQRQMRWTQREVEEQERQATEQQAMIDAELLEKERETARVVVKREAKAERVRQRRQAQQQVKRAAEEQARQAAEQQIWQEAEEQAKQEATDQARTDVEVQEVERKRNREKETERNKVKREVEARAYSTGWGEDKTEEHVVCGGQTSPSSSAAPLVVTVATSTHDWLTSVNPHFDRYGSAFMEYGYEDVSLLLLAEEGELNEALDDMEAKKPHRKLILKAKYSKCRKDLPQKAGRCGEYCTCLTPEGSQHLLSVVCNAAGRSQQQKGQYH
jgi:hypothetical protein